MSRQIKLIVDKLRGVPAGQIQPKSLSRQSHLGYFHMRYHPQAVLHPQVIKDYAHFERHTGTALLNDRMLCTCQCAIAKTSKSAVIRARLKRRLKAAFIEELRAHGPEDLPKRPMNVILMPSMKVLLAPFSELRKDAWKTYTAERDRFEKLPERKKNSMTAHGPPIATVNLQTRARPDLKGDGASQRIIAGLMKSLPQSAYLDQFGGAKVLLSKMQAVLVCK